ncbi:MAG: FG-GAP-like repeat-containing protein [Gammaproteobacteria bacterium]|nr:FG-GAP-like repeat-containing protein [Gammaproteobacteria bacterium]
MMTFYNCNKIVSRILLFLAAIFSATSFAAHRQVLLESESTVPQAGWSVSSAGDVNGDGFDDLLVGSNATVGSGTVSLFYGSATGSFSAISGSANTPDWTHRMGRRFGYVVSSAGDINGDGFGDIVIADYLNSDVVSNGGMVAVFFGSSSGLASSPDWMVYGDQTNSSFAWSISGGEDFNGDGYSDIVIGANRYTNGESEEGKIFVYHGSASGLADDDFDGIARVDEAAWTVESNVTSGRIGWAVSGAGDVNGDGFGDLIAGTGWTATATLYYGSASGLGAAPVWSASEGGGSFAGFGGSVASAGDTNNDGFDDLIVSRPATGRAFVYFGGSTPPSTTPDWTVSNVTNSTLPLPVASLGDLNGDSYDDIIVGFPGYDNAFDNAGAAMVYYGSATGPRSDGGADLQFEGDQSYAYFGRSVAALGDVEGDGQLDFIVGAPNYDHRTSGQRGVAFAYLSSSPPPYISVEPHLIHDSHIVNEAGSTSTFTVVLDTAPLVDVTIDVSTSDLGEATVSPTSLLFTPANWNMVQTVTMTGVDDRLDDGSQTSVISFNVSSPGDADYDGMTIASRSVTTLDDDCACITVTPRLSPPLVTTEAGGSSSFEVGLDADPEGVLLVNITSQDTSEGVVSTNQLIFDSSNFETPQTVIITGVDDGDLDGDITYLILNLASSSGPYNGASVSNVFVTNIDDEFQLTPSVIEGGSALDMFGRSVSGVGDVNGDGWDDFIIGAPGEENGQYREGRVHLYLGSPSGIAATPDWSAESDSNNPFFGGAVAGAGDVNNDGFDDVLISAYRLSGAFTREGRVYLYYGSASGLAATPAWTMDGGQVRAYFGRAIASAGDVNGDGFADILIGAPGYDTADVDAGRVYLYLGSATGPSVSPDWIGEGDRVRAGYGNAVASAGDINSDGYDDILLGASKYDSGGTDVGRVYLFHGSTSGPAAAADWTSSGDSSGDYYGFAVSSAGDVNGDGFADVLIGANLDTPSILSPRLSAGRLFVYHGSASGLSTTADWIFDNEQPYAQLGSSVSGIGDINGDGFDDILGGATHYNLQQENEGAALLFFGSATGLSITSVTLSMGQEQALFGASVSGAGDVDGDGIADFIVGANLYDTTGGSNAGAVFLYLSATSTTPSILVSPTTGLQTSEALTDASFTVVLATEPTASVTIPVSSSDTSEGAVNPSTLTFTVGDWSMPQTVTITGVDDGVVDGDISYAVITSAAVSADATYNALDAADVVVVNLDNDLSGITVTPTSGLLTTEAGASDSFIVVLDAAPSADVTIGLTSSDTSEGRLFVSALTFTPANWSTPQTVVVVGQDDAVIDGDIAYAVSTTAASSSDTSYNNMVVADVTVSNSDDDLLQNVTITASDAVASETGPDNATFTITRVGSTVAPLTVNYSVSGSASVGSDYTALSGSVIIGSGNGQATITVIPVDDAVNEGDETVTITLSSNAAYIIDQPAADTVTIIDNDQAALPVANFIVDQVVGEGGSFILTVVLDRPAVGLTQIPYFIGGTTSTVFGVDHTANDGTLTISTGFERASTSSISIVDDGLGDDGETIIFTMGVLANAQAGTHNAHTVTLMEGNQAPSVILDARQPVSTRTIVTTLANPVIEAVVKDPNPSDTFTYDWSLTDNALIDIDGTTTDAIFSFLSSSVSPGFYNMHVKVTDSGTSPLSTETEILLEVVDTVPTLSSSNDSDGDGIDDAAESYNDSDQDGIADYLDSSSLQENYLQQLATQSDSYIMSTDPGLKLRLGDVAFAAGADGAQVSQDDITNYGDNLGGAGLNPTDTVPNVSGYYDFEIYGLTQPGDSANIVIPQLAAIPEGAWYRKYDPVAGWRDFVVDGNNAIASAPGEPGRCPILSNPVYTSGLTPGHYCMRLTIEDGGPNDNDGVANSVIEDPGQVSIAEKEASVVEATIQTGGGGALYYMILLYFAYIISAKRRLTKRAHS